MSGPQVRSVNVGSPREGITREGLTAIDKRPTDAIEVRDPGPKQGGLGSGVIGDDVVSRKHHGGSTQAVYAVAREELDWWGAQLGRDLPDGMFGENLTTVGLEVDAAVVGERWAVGDEVVLRVCGPRVPCATFGAWMGERGWVRRFTERGRTGAYLAVEVSGTIRPGDEIRVLEQPGHGVSVPTYFRAWMGDAPAARVVLRAGAAADDQERTHLEEVAAREPIEPEDKDWTGVITAGCAECGFDPSYDVTTTGARLRATIPLWAEALRRPDASTRPAPTVWSVLEYACHVRDTARVFRGRLELMLGQDDPVFANWDQDATAVAERYWTQDPQVVAGEYAEQAESTAAAFDGVPAGDWQRPGRRSNGSVFTIETFARYFLHDVEHHGYDVTSRRGA